MPAVDLTRPAGLADAPLAALVRETIARLAGDQPERASVRLLHELNCRLGSTLQTEENRFSAAYLQELLGTYFFWVREFGATVQGEVFLELGAGAENPLAVATAMVALGAAAGYALELTPVISAEAQARALNDVLYWLEARPDLFPKLELARWREIVGVNARKFDRGELAASRLTTPSCVRLIVDVAEHTGLPARSVHRVASSSFLEHVDDPEAVVAEVARITAPGGLSVHNIDASDHGFYWGAVPSPVAFLLESAGAPSVRTCNRVRIPAFVRLFAKHGFTLLRRVDYENHAWSAEQLEARVPPFLDMDIDELVPVKSVLVFRRGD